MKKITFLLMMLFSVISYAQNDTIPVVEEGTVTTAERVIDKYSGKAYDAVKELAAALKVPAEHVYVVLVKQAVVESITMLIVFILGIIILWIGFHFWYTKCNWDSYGNPSTALGPVGIGFSIVGVIMFMVAVINIQTIVGGFINPEYYAIQEILRVLQ